MVNKQKTNSMKEKIVNYLEMCLGELRECGEGFEELATNALRQCLNTTCLLTPNCEDTLIQLEEPVPDDLSCTLINGVMLDEEDKSHVMLTVTDESDEIQTLELHEASKKAILEVITEIKANLMQQHETDEFHGKLHNAWNIL